MAAPVPQAACAHHGPPADHAQAVADIAAFAATQIVRATHEQTETAADAFPAALPAPRTEAEKIALARIAAELHDDRQGTETLLENAGTARHAAITLARWLANWITATDGQDALHELLRQ